MRRPTVPSGSGQHLHSPAPPAPPVLAFHGGIGLHIPASVHYGEAEQIRAKRAATLETASAANPARFRHRQPTRPKLPKVAWINAAGQARARSRRPRRRRRR